MATAAARMARAIDVASMEMDHQEQFRLLDALENALRRGVPPAEVETMMSQLIDHTNVHFLSEQLAMRLHAYEAYEQHLAEHDQLMAQVRDLRRRYRQGEMADLTAFIVALRNWLTVHIETADSVLSEYLYLQSSPTATMQ